MLVDVLKRILYSLGAIETDDNLFPFRQEVMGPGNSASNESVLFGMCVVVDDHTAPGKR